MADRLRPVRFSADKARELVFSRLENESDSESDVDLDSESESVDLDLDNESSRSVSSDEDRGRSRSSSPVAGPSSGKRNGTATGPGPKRHKNDRSSSNSRSKPQQPNQLWSEVTAGSTTNNFRFSAQSGLLADLDATATPLSCFRTLFTDQVFNQLLESVNSFAQQKCQQNLPSPHPRSVYYEWKPITEAEMWKFLAVTTQMGIDQKPAIRDYWSTNPPDYIPWYHQMFQRPRFEAIYHMMLHCSDDNNAVSKEKVEPFVEVLLKNYREAFYPFQDLSLDEMVIGWQGRWAYKQFNAAKPKKYHIKVFGLCDSTTSYVLNLLTYYGKETSYNPECDADSGQAKKVFHTLLAPFGKGHHIFADRYYTSYELLEYLCENKYYFTGTLNVQRRNFPPELKQQKLDHMQAKWYLSEGEKILCVSWKDKKAKKPCVAVSTSASVEMVTKPTKKRAESTMPGFIHQYNSAMNGCDRANQGVGYCGIFNRKSRKWWKKIFHWIVEITQHNSHILHILATEKKTPRASFKRRLVAEMTELASQKLTEAEKAGPKKNAAGRKAANPIERLTGNKHLVALSDKDRNCVVCSTPAQQRRTKYYCSGCTNKPYLHAKGCFEQYHSQHLI